MFGGRGRVHVFGDGCACLGTGVRVYVRVRVFGDGCRCLEDGGRVHVFGDGSRCLGTDVGV